MKTTLLTTCVALSAVTASTPLSTAAPKNVIIILADDQGYEDLSCFGSKRIKSPHIDKLAKEGMKMTNFYMASSVCSPSRAGLLTGRMPKRAGVPRIFFPYSQDGLPPEEITIAEVLKTKGYKTGLIGKWHLGHLKQFLLTNQGFDYFYGMPYSNDMTIAKELPLSSDPKLVNGYTMGQLQKDTERYGKRKHYLKMKGTMPLMRNNEVIEYPVDQTTITKRYTEEAVKFITDNKDKPFFLFMPHAMPHGPIHVSKMFKGSSKNGLYCDSIQEIDCSVGQVVQALKDNDLDKDTIIIYTSDNGPANYRKTPTGGSAGPFNGVKFDTYEGGIRVPTVIWSPGEVKAGVTCDETVSALDLFKTIAGYADADIPIDRIYDGYDIRNLLTGKTSTSPRNEIYYYEANTENLDGIRVGDWKYVRKGGYRLPFKKGQKPMRVTEENTKPQLYNLKNDRGEAKNLYISHPEVAKELIRKMKAFDKSIK